MHLRLPLTSIGIEYVLRKIQRFEGTQGLVVLITYDGLRGHKDSLNLIEWTGHKKESSLYVG
jgi:hypothetical protein